MGTQKGVMGHRATRRRSKVSLNGLAGKPRRNGPDAQPGTSLFDPTVAHRKSLENELSCHFQISAVGVRQLNLTRGTALRFEDLRRANDDRHAFGAGCRNIEPVEAVEEFHPARRIRMARCSGRIDGDRRFLTLKLVHRADPRSWQILLNLEDLRVIGRDYKNIAERDRLLLPLAIDPRRIARAHRLYEMAHR